MASRASTARAHAVEEIVPRLRRIALWTQGLLGTSPFGRGETGVAHAIERLGYVQIDTISVVERAHHHVLYNRVPDYRPQFLDALLRRGEVFEYWHHAAAFLPIRDYRFALPRMAQFKQGDERWIRSRDRASMQQVLDRIRADGALRSRDFIDPSARSRGWWDWKPAKRALEQLFMEGELMVVSREGFEKTYDLTERVLPSTVNTTLPSAAELAEHLVTTTLASHGCAQAPTFTHLRRGTALRNAVKTTLHDKLSNGELIELRTPDGQVWYTRRELWEARAPVVRQHTARILSPFDNSVIHRSRGQRLFNFDYVIECYVPEAKRRYGYFCLPVLLGDSFIGRIDVKAHRKERRLELRHVHLETNPDTNLTPLVRGLRQFATFNACDEITLGKVSPASWKQNLQHALKET